MTKQSVLDQAKTLSKQEQMELAFDLWDLVDGSGVPTSVSPELAAELDRRIAEDDTDTSPGVEFSVLRDQILRGEL